MKNHASIYIDINKKLNLLNQAELNVENNLQAICWVSSNNVIIAELNWPKTNLKSSKKHVLAPFLIEDVLLTPAEEIHYLVKENTNNKDIFLGIDKQILSKIHSDIGEINISSIDAIVPDILAVPYYDDKFSVWHEGDYSLVRTSAYTGFSGNTEWVFANLKVMLHINKQQELVVFADDKNLIPTEIQQYVERKPSTWHDILQEASIPIMSDVNHDSLNLLKKKVILRKRANNFSSKTKIALATISFAIVMYILSTLLSVFNMMRINQVVKDNIEQQYQIILQNNTRNTAAQNKAVVASKVNNINKYIANYNNSNWILMKKAFNILKKYKGINIKKVNFSNNLLEIYVDSVEKISDLEKLSDKINNTKSSVKFDYDANQKVFHTIISLWYK
jgi:type II secretory pathway component PulL